MPGVLARASVGMRVEWGIDSCEAGDCACALKLQLAHVCVMEYYST